MEVAGLNEEIVLITKMQSVDVYGDRTTTESRSTVFAAVKSIGLKEFYQAQATGLQPEIKFVIADYLDYQGEMYVEYNLQIFRVLRTYRTGLELELVCYREVNP